MWTIGIITDGKNDILLQQSVDSVRKAFDGVIHEIIIVGNTSVKANLNIPFLETAKQGWITRKKNTITLSAKYENIVYLHDYFALSEGWLKAFKGLDFKIAMTQIKNKDGSRFRDWCIDAEYSGKLGRRCMIPYDMKNLSKIMYISGGFWIAKRDVMVQFPLDERRVAGQEEDIEWSHHVRQYYNFTMAYHPESYAMILKDDKRCVLTEMSQDIADVFNSMGRDALNEIRDYTEHRHAQTSWKRGLPCYGRRWGNDGWNQNV